jgi:hypothetical protein
MRAFLALLLLAAGPAAGAYAAELPVLLSAGATSSSDDSSPITCLLDSGCNGHWQPKALDGGNDEGIYLQFAENTPVDYIKVSFANVKDPDKKLRLQVYLDGKTTTKELAVMDVKRKEEKTPGSVSFLIGTRIVSNFYALLPLNTKARSIYLKLDYFSNGYGKTPEITRISFYKHNFSVTLNGVEPLTLPAPIAIKLPVLVPAEVTATSILAPELAYHPAHLFDSQTDMAWATDGKKTEGPGESVTVRFASTQTISGLLVWNGYQRSPTHFSSNGRVAALAISADNAGQAQEAALQDKQEMQTIRLSTPVINSGALKLEIKSVYPGSKYKDVLISELRFKDAAGNIILPVAELPKTEVPLSLKPLIDRSLASFLHPPVLGGEPECTQQCNNNSIRIRSNGTFVMYLGYDYGSTINQGDDGTGEVSSKVIEGNWEAKDGQVRIFGKKYVTSLRSSEYLRGKIDNSRAEIFQSGLKISAYGQLPEAKRRQILFFLYKSMKTKRSGKGEIFWPVGLDIKKLGTSYFSSFFEGAAESEVIKKADLELKKLNPFYIESSVYSGLVLPVAQVQTCMSGC